MTDPLKSIETLAEIARDDRPPAIDVSRRVAASIRELEMADPYTPLKWIAALSGMSAAVLAFSIIPLYQLWSDPITLSIFNLFRDLL